jgi:hypothetical protein
MAMDDIARFLEPFVEGVTKGYLHTTRAVRDPDPNLNKNWRLDFTNDQHKIERSTLSIDFDIFEESPDDEWYFTPGVFKDRVRRESKFLSTNALWVDFDEPVDWKSLDPQPSIVVQSSKSGKAHCYWLLKKPLKNVPDVKYWNARLQQNFGSGADKSGIDAAQILKLPFGQNMKLANMKSDGTFYRPELLKCEPTEKYALTAFKHLEEPGGVSLNETATDDIGDVPDTRKSWDAYAEEYGVPATLKLKIYEAGNSNDKSGALWFITNSLIDLELEPEQIFQVLHRSPADKFTTSAHLWEDVCRVKKKLEVETEPENILGQIKLILLSKMEGIEKTDQIVSLTRSELESCGRYIRTEEDDFYYMDVSDPEKPDFYRVGTQTNTRYAGLISTKFGLRTGINQGLVKDVLHDGVYNCMEQPPKKFSYLAHFDEERSLLYVDRYDNTMYVLDGESITAQPYGYDEVYFYPKNDVYPKAYTYTPEYPMGGLESLIFTGPNYTPMGGGVSPKHIKQILRTWVATAFFPNVMPTRPILVFFGPADSGKSTFFQNLSHLLTGNALGNVIGIPTKETDFNVQVCQNPFIFYDNVEVNKAKIQEQLAKAATGYSVRERKMYSNSEQSTMTARAFIGITTRTLERIQDDVSQRYIIISLTPYSVTPRLTRKTASEIRSMVDANRDFLWSELLDYLNSLVSEIARHGLTARREEKKLQLRLADFALFLHLTSDMAGVSGNKLEKFIKSQQASSVDANDPLIDVIKKFCIESPQESSKFNSSSYLHPALTDIDPKFLRTYKSPRKLTERLKSIDLGILESHGILQQFSDSGGNVAKFKFFYDPKSDCHPE